MKNRFYNYILIVLAGLYIALPVGLQAAQGGVALASAQGKAEMGSVEKLEHSLRWFFTSSIGAVKQAGTFGMWTVRQCADFSAWWMEHFGKHPKTTAVAAVVAAFPIGYRILQYYLIKETLDEARLFCREIIISQNGDIIPDGEPDTKNYNVFSTTHLPSRKNDTIYVEGKKQTESSNRQVALDRSNYSNVVKVCDRLLDRLAKYSFAKEYFSGPKGDLTNYYRILTNPLNYDDWLMDPAFDEVSSRFEASVAASGCPQYYSLTSMPSVWLGRFSAMASQHSVVSSARSIEQLILEPYAGEATRLYIFVKLIKNWLEAKFANKEIHFSNMRKIQLQHVQSDTGKGRPVYFLHSSNRPDSEEDENE